LLATSAMPGRADPCRQYHFIDNLTSEAILKTAADI
jgi:hypothetical protein